MSKSYNKKRVTIIMLSISPLPLSAYDTVDSAWVILLMRMYAHLFSNPLGQFDIDVNNNATPRKIPYDVVPDKIPTGSQNGPTYGFNLGYSDNNQGYNPRLRE